MPLIIRLKSQCQKRKASEMPFPLMEPPKLKLRRISREEPTSPLELIPFPYKLETPKRRQISKLPAKPVRPLLPPFPALNSITSSKVPKCPLMPTYETKQRLLGHLDHILDRMFPSPSYSTLYHPAIHKQLVRASSVLTSLVVIHKTTLHPSPPNTFLARALSTNLIRKLEWFAPLFSQTKWYAKILSLLHFLLARCRALVVGSLADTGVSLKELKDLVCSEREVNDVGEMSGIKMPRRLVRMLVEVNREKEKEKEGRREVMCKVKREAKGKGWFVGVPCVVSFEW